MLRFDRRLHIRLFENKIYALLKLLLQFKIYAVHRIFLYCIFISFECNQTTEHFLIHSYNLNIKNNWLFKIANKMTNIF